MAYIPKVILPFLVSLALAALVGLGVAHTERAHAVGTLTTLGAGPGAPVASCADPNWSSVVLLAGNDNAANGSTTFVDQSASAHTLTRFSGTTAYSNTTAPTGMTTSIRLAGVITSPDSADWFFGSGAFTIEAMVRFDNVSADNYWAGQWPVASANDSWFVNYGTSANLRLVVSDGSAVEQVISAWSPSNNTWYHIAMVRSGNTGYLFVNGSQQGASAPITITLKDSTALFNIGGVAESFVMSGYLASLRITKGVARYTGTFTPPSLPLPNC